MLIYCLLTDDSMLMCFRFMGLTVRVGDLDWRLRLGETRTRRAPFMGLVRAPPSNLTRRGEDLDMSTRSEAARRSSGVYAPY